MYLPLQRLLVLACIVVGAWLPVPVQAQDDTAPAGVLRYSTEEGAVTIQLSGERIDTCDNPCQE